KVQLVFAPLALHKVLGQHKERFVALLYGINDIVHNPLPGHKVTLMEAEPEGGAGLLQLTHHYVFHPVRVVLAVGNKSVVADVLRGGSLGLPLGLEPRPGHSQVPDCVVLVADNHEDEDDQEHQGADQHHHEGPVALHQREV
ncbi:hypothetical protein N336_00032, partial [Phalacrocorax carbo]